MIRRYDPSYIYEITAQCIKCNAEWLLVEPRPVDIWWQLYQKKWELHPEMESPQGILKAKCGVCAAAEAKVKKEERKLQMAQIALEKSINQTIPPMIESVACMN